MTDERSLDWEGCVNVRDLGGLPTVSGQPTRFGAMVRSDNPAFLTAKGWNCLHAYGVRTIVALRTIGATDEEPGVAVVPDDVEIVRVPIEDITDREFCETRVNNRLWGTPLYFADALARWPAMAARAVGSVARAKPGGVVISCGRGCDRTGFLTMLTLHLVGVPAEPIITDSCLSFGQWSRREPDYEPTVRATMAEHGTTIEAAFISVLNEPLDAILATGGLRRDDIGRLQARMLGPRPGGGDRTRSHYFSDANVTDADPHRPR